MLAVLMQDHGDGRSGGTDLERPISMRLCDPRSHTVCTVALACLAGGDSSAVTLIQPPEARESPIEECAISDDGRTIAAGERSGRVLFFRLQPGSPAPGSVNLVNHRVRRG